MKNTNEQSFKPLLSIINYSGHSHSEVAVCITGMPNVEVKGSTFSDIPTAIMLTDCGGIIDIKKNQASHVHKFIEIRKNSIKIKENSNLQLNNGRNIEEVKVKKIRHNWEYEIKFKNKINELLNLEAHARQAKNSEELARIKFIKANLKLKI